MIYDENITNRICTDAAATALSAKTVYLATTGSDSNPCTYASPCRTMTPVFGLLNPGDTVLALDSVDFTPTNFLNISPSTTIDGGAHGSVMSGVNGNYVISFANTIPSTYVIRNMTIYTGTGAGSFPGHPKRCCDYRGTRLRFRPHPGPRQDDRRVAGNQ